MGKKFWKRFFTNFHSNYSEDGNSIGHKKTKSDISDMSEDSIGKEAKELFKKINDRKFINQDDAKEILPVDDDETDRINLVHFFKKELWPQSKASFSSPVKEILRSGAEILDAGCGGGTWVLEMSGIYPNSNFTGIDIVPIFPSQIKPINSTFVTANLLEKLPYEDNTFDYIHFRNMMFSLSEDEYEIAVIELVRVLKPGGWIEVEENSGVMNNLGPTGQKLKQMSDAAYFKTHGINVYITDHIQQFLENSQQMLDNAIYLDKAIVPYGLWGGKLGATQLQLFKWFCTNVKTKLLSIVDLTEQEYDNMVDNTCKEILDSDN
ncbi:20794_t:CDS:2, partial [Entrophospora sp. SA101]